MNQQTQIERLQKACPDLSHLMVQDFVERMDHDYFEQFTLKVAAEHLTSVSSLTQETPCVISIKKQPKSFFQLTIIAYDYFSEFATLCGLLSSFGLDIRQATIYTYRDRRSTDRSQPSHIRQPASVHPHPIRSPKQPLGLFRKKVVDVFNVQLLPGCIFGTIQQTRFKNSVRDMIKLLENRHFRQVRSHVNRALIETLGRIDSQVPNVIHPVEIQFNNDRSYDATVMNIRSTDIPAFLYTFANALTMRGVYISKANIQVQGHTAHNEFFVQGRSGGKIVKSDEQQELISTAALLKEFSHYLTWAPDPGKALEYFDQLLDELYGSSKRSLGLSLLQEKPILGQLAKLFGSSDFLWEDLLRRQHANLLPAMTEFKEGSMIRTKSNLTRSLMSRMKKYRTTEERQSCLNTFKDQELFRIDMKHLIDTATLEEFSTALSTLAEVVLEQALIESQQVIAKQYRKGAIDLQEQYAFSIFGLGKLGGAELGYASDIEVLFVYETKQPARRQGRRISSEYFELLVQEILRWIDAKKEGIFHIDTRLRPYGEKGLLANSFNEICEYYNQNGSAAPFERQALIKLRHVAGDRELGKKVEQYRNTYVYSEEPWPLDVALHLRDRQIKELVPDRSIHVKYSQGGIIDIEYLIQYFQLFHGPHLPPLRSTNTLQALDVLKANQLIQSKDSKTLHEDYLFFRKLIDALRIVRGNALDLILPEPQSDSMIFLARRLGFVKNNWDIGASELEKEINRRMKRTRKVFDLQLSRFKTTH